MHPYIPKEKSTLSVDASLTASIHFEGQSHSFPIPTGPRFERTIENALLHIASGITPSRIASHFTNHTLAESSCPCCKLEGRILSGMGRKPPELSRRPASTGTVQIRRIPLGRTADQLLAQDKLARARQRTKDAMLKALATPQRRTSVPIEELI